MSELFHVSTQDDHLLVLLGAPRRVRVAHRRREVDHGPQAERS